MRQLRQNIAAAQQAEADLLRPEINAVEVSETQVIVTLDDRREIKVPLDWYPRLMHGRAAERQHFEIQGNAIYWPDLDEDIDVRGILLGRPSKESAASFQHWLGARKQGDQNKGHSP